MSERGGIAAALATLGFGKTMEKKLHTVGIHSAEDLLEIGSKQAAIQGVEIKQLSKACKAALKAYFKQL